MILPKKAPCPWCRAVGSADGNFICCKFPCIPGFLDLIGHPSFIKNKQKLFLHLLCVCTHVHTHVLTCHRARVESRKQYRRDTFLLSTLWALGDHTSRSSGLAGTSQTEPCHPPTPTTLAAPKSRWFPKTCPTELGSALPQAPDSGSYEWWCKGGPRSHAVLISP